MQKTLDLINQHVTDFQKESVLQLEKGNKAAGVRARKAALEITKLMKEYRKMSNELDKK